MLILSVKIQQTKPHHVSENQCLPFVLFQPVKQNCILLQTM